MLFDEQWEGSYNRVSTAIQKGDFSLFVQFVRERASLNSSDNRGWQPIHEAVITNLGPEFLMVLLRYESVQVDARTYEGETALLLACKYAKKENVALSCAQILIKCGANVNLPDNENETPLMFAVKNDMMSVVHLLLCQPTIEIDYSDLGGWSPLHEACVLNRVQVVQMLLDRGANVLNKDECGMTCIFSCAHSGNLETLKLLCDYVRSQGHVEYLDYGPSDLTTPLMIAAQRGFTNCVRLLHESGANIDAMASDKVTALHLATQMGNFETVEYLLSNMNFKNCLHFIPIEKA